MKDLSETELLEKLFLARYSIGEKAFNQIVKLIEDWYAYLKRAKDADERLTQAGLMIASQDKPKVSKEFVEKWWRVIMIVLKIDKKVPKELYENLIIMLQEAGVEVEK